MTVESLPALAPQGFYSNAEGWVVFAFTGHISPERITGEIGIDPDRVYPAPPGRGMIWQIHSTLPASESLFRHFEEILKRLMPARRKIRNLAKECQAEFYCSMYRKKDSTEMFEMPSRYLLLMGYLGAAMALDIIEKQEEM